MSRLEATSAKSKPSGCEKEKDFSLPTKPKPGISGSQASLLTHEKTLNSIMKVDLLKEKKLEWVECNLNEWREYVEDNARDDRGDDPVKYYIYRYKGISVGIKELACL